jgi:hypothetical protein
MIYIYDIKDIHSVEEKEERDEKLKRERLQVEKEEEEASCKRKYAAYHAFSDVVVVTSEAEFRKVVVDEHKPDNRTDFCELCRDQIRLQTHLYGIPPDELPNIGGSASEAECHRLIAAELQKFIIKVFSRKVPSKLHVPSPGAAPTDEATEMFEDRVAKNDAQMAHLMGLANHGATFSASMLRPLESKVSGPISQKYGERSVSRG